MKQLEKKDLKIGDIFISGNNFNFINKEGTKFSIHQNKISKHALFDNTTGYFSYENLRKSTPEQKHWLEVCIAANSFISYEETMKTFIPEYVECTLQQIGSDYKLGEIYKVNSTSQNVNKIESHNNQGMAFYQMNKHRFKPSTKEAYDAQFVVKEPEFMLPEIWWIKITKENLKDISKFLNFNLGEHTIGFVAGMVKSYKSGAITKGYNSTPTTSYGSTFGNEITFEQFKKHVLKEQLEEPKDKVLNLNTFLKQIQKVESSEGSIFEIGDKIQVFGGSKNPILRNRKYLTIIGFRWNSNKTSICAITELYGTNGIGLDKIELYSEPVVKELSLLEQAKLKYPIGTKFKPLNTNIVCEITTNLFEEKNNHIWEKDINSYNIHSNGVSHYIYDGYFNKWAEIIENNVKY